LTEIFATTTKNRIIDQHLLIKLVFGTQDKLAQRKLMEEPNLDLATAVRIIETHEALLKTTNILDDKISATVTYTQCSQQTSSHKPKTNSEILNKHVI